MQTTHSRVVLKPRIPRRVLRSDERQVPEVHVGSMDYPVLLHVANADQILVKTLAIVPSLIKKTHSTVIVLMTANGM